ncbi:MAG: hypothetical protein VYC40_04700 [Pseudomonadota bacterium]|nr:hypothetical protein [Pseudomonadota bacterium]
MTQTTYEEVSIGIETTNQSKETEVVQQTNPYPKATPVSMLHSKKGQEYSAAYKIHHLNPT